MQNKIVEVPQMKTLIKPAPGFVKKQLADYKLDILALCGFGCLYCSSNMGNYLRIHQKEFAGLTKAQIGKEIMPSEDPSLMMVWPDVVNQLADELRSSPKSFGQGLTLMFSMLTDGFSPKLVDEGITKLVLDLILEKTSFRIRVLTKNAIVGSPEWIKFFAENNDRFVVGLSTGSLDDAWCRRMELGTSSPRNRFVALHNLQEAGVPTFGMLCPVFPDMMEDNSLERMIESVNPDLVETIWAEPYNDRVNWRVVRNSYQVNSKTYNWFTNVYDYKLPGLWSSYATDMYTRLKRAAIKQDWLPKLKYLLYEDKVMMYDAIRFNGFEGVLLQSKPADDGKSKNPSIAALQ